MPQIRILTLISVLAGIIGIGTVFFRWAEGWSWLDSYFFTVVTLSTVGYGNFVPVTVSGKIGTTVFIFLGLGVFALFIQQIGVAAVQHRERHKRYPDKPVNHDPPHDNTDPHA